MLKTILTALNIANNRSGSGGKPEITKSHSSKIDFLTLKAQMVFIQLRKIFNKAPIISHFHKQRHIQIKTNVSSYTISRILRQMISDQQLSHFMTANRISSLFKTGQ